MMIFLEAGLMILVSILALPVLFFVAATAAELLPFYGSAATLENVPSFITDLKMKLKEY